MTTKRVGRWTAAATALCAATVAPAATVTLDFEGLKNGESLLGFYSGGTASQGSTGANYGITFNTGAVALIDSDAGGTGSIGNEPSPSTVMAFSMSAPTSSVVLNLAQGFADFFSFAYSSVNAGGTVRVFSGQNATGNLLGVIDVRALGSNCMGDPTGQYCNWATGELFFDGVARSIDFGGTANQLVFDNVTFGNLTVPGTGGGTVPEPTSLALLGAALVAASLSRRRRYRTNWSTNAAPRPTST